MSAAKLEPSIRQVQESDLSRCVEIEAACFPPEEAASENSIRVRLSEYPEGFLVMELEKKVVGIINSGAIHDEDLSNEELKVLEGHDPLGPNLVIFSVAVDPAHQGSGLSRPLLEGFFERARELQKKSILLICKEPLVPYYERFDFQNLGKSPSTHGGATWYQMKKHLRR